MVLRFHATEEARIAFDVAQPSLRPTRRGHKVTDGDRRKLLLRRWGARLLAERGIDGATMTDIALKAGMHGTGFSPYYPNRQHLIDGIVFHHAMELHECLEAADPLPMPNEPDGQLAAPPLQRLETMARALLDAMVRHEAEHRVQLAALHPQSEAFDADLRFHVRGLVRRVERVLWLAIPRLKRRPALLTPLAMSFFAMAGYFVLWFRDEGPLSRSDYARLMVQMTVAGGKAGFRTGVGKARGTGKRRSRVSRYDRVL